MRLHWLMSIGMAAALAPLPGRAQAPDPARAEAAALASAEAWLATVDGKGYDGSWEQAAGLFRASIGKDAWTRAVAAVREPLGAVQTRRKTSATFARSLPGAPDGAYVVLQFETRFEHKAAAVETVTSMLDRDGVWRVAGYFVR
jgi:hypothetical protein